MDCTNYNKMKSIINKHKPDAVIHFAELPSAPFSMLNNRYGWETLHNNLQSTFNLIHCIKDIVPDCHIIKLGTIKVNSGSIVGVSTVIAVAVGQPIGWCAITRTIGEFSGRARGGCA